MNQEKRLWMATLSSGITSSMKMATEDERKRRKKRRAAKKARRKNRT
jgi:hypothetical protein